MPVPDYITDQELSYLTARGYNFKNFSAEQVMDELDIKHKSSDEILAKLQHKKIPAQDTYNEYVNWRYIKEGYKEKKNTAISGGFVWAKD